MRLHNDFLQDDVYNITQNIARWPGLLESVRNALNAAVTYRAISACSSGPAR